MPNFIRLIIGFALVGAAVALMIFSLWGWGILLIFVSILVLITFFYNENMLIDQWHLRKDNMAKAEVSLGRIKNFERELYKVQYGYYNLLT